MSDRIWRRWSRRRRLRGALAGAAIGGLILATLPASPAAATGPSLIADASCTTGKPYGGAIRTEGFAPNDAVSIIVVIYRSSGNEGFPFSMVTDGNGAATLATNEAEPNPFRIGTLFFHDLNHDGHYNQGDELIANLLLTIDQPCTGAVAQPK